MHYLALGMIYYCIMLFLIKRWFLSLESFSSIEDISLWHCFWFCSYTKKLKVRPSVCLCFKCSKNLNVKHTKLITYSKSLLVLNWIFSLPFQNTKRRKLRWMLTPARETNSMALPPRLRYHYTHVGYSLVLFNRQRLSLPPENIVFYSN
jgi:hypothetical protein